jgi:hypothetical protein
MKNKILLTSTLVLIASIALGQTQSATLDYNNSRIGVLNGGDFFWDLNNSKYEVPKTNGTTPKSTIFSSSIWLGAEEEDGTVHLSAMTYRQRGQDFWPGPHSNNSGATRTKYDKMYEVSQEEINAHKINSTSPIQSIQNWPGNGDTTKGEPYQLAPFVDLNKNGKYEPSLGDYPSIKGTGAVYCVYSDQGIHTESGGRALGVDVHQLFYQDVSAGFEEVNLASFTVINRSDTTYTNFKFGVFVDFDLGNFADDFVGCDSTSNMIYAYNGDDNDEGVLGYGLNPPAQNMMFLNQKMGGALYYNNNTNRINGNPNSASDFYNYLCINWKNGTKMVDNGTPSNKINYMFSGDPVANTGWTELQSGNTPADRRMLAVAEETSLSPGEVKCYEIAFVYGRATSGGAVASITEMKAVAATVQEAYDANTYGWKTSCALGAQEEEENAGIYARKELTGLTVYPNPSTGSFTIKGLKTDKPSIVTTISGQEVRQVRARASSFDISDLESGVYFLKTEVGSVRLLKL